MSCDEKQQESIQLGISSSLEGFIRESVIDMLACLVGRDYSFYFRFSLANTLIN